MTHFIIGLFNDLLIRVHYWVHPQYEIIAVPTGEEKSLLNLPDLYHETGHLIYKQHEEDLLGTFKIEIGFTL